MLLRSCLDYEVGGANDEDAAFVEADSADKVPLEDSDTPIEETCNGLDDDGDGVEDAVTG